MTSAIMGPGGRALLCGCPLDALTLDDAVAVVDGAVAERRPMQHSALNAAKLVRIQRDEMLRAAVVGSELVTADGQAVVWAARLLGQPVPERVTGIDLFEALLERATVRGYGVFVLGGRPEAAERAAEKIRALHP